MKIIALRETYLNEKRVSITPQTALLLAKEGYEILLEKSFAVEAGFSDEEYLEAKAVFFSNKVELIQNADIICKIFPSAQEKDFTFPELHYAKKNVVILGMFSSYLHQDYITQAKQKGVRIISLNLLPRISRLQNADALSSQNNLIGYRAVIEACFMQTRSFPMMMSAAGTLFPVKLLVLGVGVAGLQAIATAKRLGAVVSAYDIRINTKEQVESLGAKFLHPGSIKDSENASGYANSLDEDQEKIQENFLCEIIGNFDVIITFAQIPNQAAPLLINDKIFSKIKKNTVIVDTSVDYGGNVIFSQNNTIVTKNDIKILGCSNLASKIPYDASILYANNVFHLLKFLYQDQQINFKDKLIQNMLLT